MPRLGGDSGTCDYCGANADILIDPGKLQDYFELLLGAYKPDISGCSLLEQLESDWGLLSSDRIHPNRAAELLVAIVGDRAVATEPYGPVAPDDEGPLQKWHEFRVELMQRNRYFPKSLPDLDRLRELLAYLLVIPGDRPHVMFRARIIDGEVPYPPESMGPPPAALSTHGRANPAGIPYLYLASDQSTAVSELRPHTGDRACVADFRLADGLVLVDLRDPKRTVSPFAMSDEGQIVSLRRDLAFLNELGVELTRPVGPRAAPIEYLPSQYLCEFIKDCGFDGVMYRSSVSKGVNVALFDAANGTVGDVTQYRVARVEVAIERELLK